MRFSVTIALAIAVASVASLPLGTPNGAVAGSTGGGLSQMGKRDHIPENNRPEENKPQEHSSQDRSTEERPRDPEHLTSNDHPQASEHHDEHQDASSQPPRDS
ncbi:hypothetical protein IW145_004124, partial [Coemansia sp. RSA 521]